jgi:DNA-binding response OmpR family regulator
MSSAGLMPPGYTVQSDSVAAPLDSAQPGRLLIDVVMPNSDGHEVRCQLKAVPAIHDTPILLVTTHDDEAAEMLGLELNTADCISRPRRHHQLCAAMQRAPSQPAAPRAKPGEPSADADVRSNQINASPDALARVRCS